MASCNNEIKISLKDSDRRLLKSLNSKLKKLQKIPVKSRLKLKRKNRFSPIVLSKNEFDNLVEKYSNIQPGPIHKIELITQRTKLFE